MESYGLRLDVIDALSDATCTGGMLRLECGDIADDILDGGIELPGGALIAVVTDPDRGEVWSLIRRLMDRMHNTSGMTYEQRSAQLDVEASYMADQILDTFRLRSVDAPTTPGDDA